MSYSTEEHFHNPTLREDVFLRRHHSGLPVYFCPRPGFQKRYACFATRFGSIDMSFARAGGSRIDVPAGVAHFLEHKLFEGKDGNALEKFSRFGASGNAYTSFDVTNYLFSCNSDFRKNLDLLISFVQEPYFTHENVEKEKGIIGQEIHMYEDDPRWQIFMNLIGALYHRHTVREDIAGTIESITAIDKATLDQCYETFYHPENMVLFVIGDEERDSLFDHIDGELSRKTYEPLGDVGRFYPDEPDSIRESRVSVNMEVSMPRVLMGFKELQNGGGKPLLRREFVSDILLELLFGKATGFYQRLYEEQLIDEGFGGSYSGYAEMGQSMISGETPEPERLVDEIRGEIDRVRREGVSEEDFVRQKRAATGSFLRLFNSMEFIANNYSTYRLADIDLFDIIDELHSIELDEVTARLESHLVEEGMAVSTVLPK